MSDTVFDQNTSTETSNNNSNPSIPPTVVDKLKSIVNENGQPKYDSIEKALEALVHSQAHIKTLETEAQSRASETESLREKAAQADALEAVVQRLQQNNNPAQVTPKAGMSEAQTVEALEKIVERREAARIANANLQSVQSTLISKFGSEDATRLAVAEKAKELGISTQDLAALSSKSPKAVLAYFGVEAPKVNTQPVTPSQNTTILPKTEEPLKRPEKSVLLGATSQEQKAFMAKVKEDVYKRLGVET